MHQLIAQPSFAAPSKGGSALSLAKRDQTDVGISKTLRPGFGFFGPLHAAPPDTPCGDVCPVARPGEVGSFSMFCNEYEDDLGPLCAPAAIRSRGNGQ